ncbi:hypothetical protein SBOR_7541 [Sclerotinia borealis F-4128]|uniref:Bromo domain-containing protein n=1 Tax=Sclerotinia borealis (strain F-4128) TaxID=1432307 RepID=W9CB49_SCLBF|nr:hypothetical protein SBOR_7541 [Sclerotinia borealis F-4128]
MNTTTAYTPLECLLLFQSLVAYGTDPNSFIQISQFLTNNFLVKDGETYDAGRLSADLLEDLYLRLLREELKNDAEQDVQEENGPSPSKKRKLSSPLLPTIKDAQPYREKLPVLVERLYARYRDYMVRAIREDEENYRTVQRDIAAIERGDWDERILREEGVVAEQNGHRQAEDSGTKPSGFTSNVPVVVEGKPQESKPLETGSQDQRPTESKRLEPQLPQIKSFEIAIPQSVPQVLREQTRTIASPSPGPSPRTEGRPEGLSISDVLNTHNSTPIPPPKQVSEQQPRNGAQHGAPPMAQQRSGSHGPHGPSPLQTQTHSPQPGPPPLQWEPPFHPGPNPPQFHNSQPGSPHPSPHSQFYPPQFPPHPYPPHSFPPPNHRNSLPSPHLPPPHHSVPSSPLNPQYQQGVLLPPPHMMGRSSSTSGTQLDALADIAGQQYRAPSGSPMIQQGPLPPVSMPQGSMSQTPYTHSFPPPQRSLSSTGNPPPQWNPPFQPPYPVPNYQLNGPQTNRPPFPRPDLVVTENRQYNSPYNANQGPRPSLPMNTPVQLPRPQLSQPHTPLFQAPHSFMTGSGTKWSPRPSGATPRLHKEPPRPQAEPLSPVLKPKVLPQSVEKSSQKKGHSKPDPVKPGKASIPITLNKRAGSVTSTHTTGPIRRSQSVQSHADELSLDTENSVLHFKQEVATPRGISDVGDIAADESTSRQSKVPPSPRQAMKRKRLDSPELREPRGPPLFVLWTRAFPKISASALESISGHRNASTFANPVKERDAPGYKDLILRPQDLKSIRTAITAGHKAAAAVAAAQVTPDDQGQSSAWLPISEDLIPPKGIINYAQFEKELMRMFANAIMFNPDPDRGFGRTFENKRKESEKGGVYEIDENSLVKDTRAMFMDVEKDIGALRSAERRSEEAAEREALGGPWGIRHPIGHAEADDDEVDELAGDIDGAVGNAGGLAKRRKKA